MRTALTISLVVAVLSNVVWADEEDDLVIDNFYFTWTVAESGNARFQIEKDEKSTNAWLRVPSASFSMTPQDAEAVGAALTRTDEFFEKFKDSTEKAETIRGGQIVVEFSTTDEGDFHVTVTPAKWKRVGAVLTKTQARALAVPMKKAVRAAALVDEKVKF
jgi:hypothetical protein